MKKILFLLTLSFLLHLSFSVPSSAQDSVVRKGIQVSLLTCGTGDEIYSVFGHTAVRILDSAAGTDIVYNYGTFEYGEDFELQFMKGKLLYYLSEERYSDFVDLYQSEGRWIEEQVLVSSEADKRKIQDYLLTNLLPENRAYKYDFFFDNCATRIRDIFTQTHGKAFLYPNVLPHQKSLSFRDIINQYLARNVWERFGINVLLGSKIDVKMSNSQIMFLPDYLRDAVGGATLDGKRFVSKAELVVKEQRKASASDYSVLIVLYGMLILLAAGLFVPKLKLLGLFMSNFILVVTGLLGVLIIVMWLGTDHQNCANNYNLLWALPTNLYFAFKKKQYKYAMIAIVLIFVSMFLHLLGIQQLLLPEMIAVLAMLLLIFSSNYRKYKKDIDGKEAVTA